MLKIVIFGIGRAYTNKKFFFQENIDTVKIIAFLDNNLEYQGRELDGIPIINPEDVKDLNYDCIVILSKKFETEMKQQLLKLGIEKDTIWGFDKLKPYALRGKRTLYSGKKVVCKSAKGKILIITTHMSFSGGILVAVYVAQALQNMGYEVLLAAPSIEESVLQEVVNGGLNIMLWYSLPYIFGEDEEWIASYDFVIVNVFQMMNCAYEISKIRPVLWWIHEDRTMWESVYQKTQNEFPEINISEWMNSLEILGVSNIAEEAFNYFYPSVIKRTMPFGIPERNTNIKKISKYDKVIFAMTAVFVKRKGQRILVEAVKKLPYKEKKEIEIWFIGPDGKNQQELEELCNEEECVRFFGSLSHEEVIAILPQIDVLVCPSLSETMSMSTIEGMMFEKLCITTDMTGVAEYIKDGENGFVVKAGDSNELAERMAWIINNRDKWDPIKKEARKTYENEFTLEKFGQRLEAELKNCKERFYENTVNVSSAIS